MQLCQSRLNSPDIGSGFLETAAGGDAGKLMLALGERDKYVAVIEKCRPG